jgi:hypothetical protein
MISGIVSIVWGVYIEKDFRKVQQNGFILYLMKKEYEKIKMDEKEKKTKRARKKETTVNKAY